MQLHDDQMRGRKAQELLDNELLKDALQAMEREVFNQWVDCPARDKEGKEALWQLIKTHRKFEALLKGYVETGKLATERLNRLNDEQNRLQRFLRRA